MLEEKYIELLLSRCLKLDNQPLFINYNKLNKNFVKKIVKFANNLGITDIYLDERDLHRERSLIESIDLDEIDKVDYFNCKIWDEYAKKNAAFLLLDSYVPGLMEEINSEKLAKVSYVKQRTKPIYKEMQLKGIIPWCIAVVPNDFWAKDLFPQSKDPLNDFWKILANICMLNNENPISSWNKLLKEQSIIVKKLNNLKIKKLYFKNDLGTNIEIELSKKALWQSACSNKWIVNMPSYEIFTSPDYKKTNGIVYSSKPLVYNGKLIDKFYLKFENGKIVDFNAEKGKDILKEIINTDKLSGYLGEVALVNYNSPISNTKKIFKTTLLDENASCHLALGSGFFECIENGNNYSSKELDRIGLNSSKNHVDFMIGTKDLMVEAETKDGKITIMKNGNLVI